MIVDGDRLEVRTRRSRRITDAVTELNGLAGRGLGLCLDGELILGAGRLEDFARLRPRMAMRPSTSAEPVTFAAFDVTALDGESLIELNYVERRERLEALDLDGCVQLVPRLPASDTTRLLAACEAEGMEGVVLKRMASRYRPGVRTSDWRKVKCPGWAAYAEQHRPQ